MHKVDFDKENCGRTTRDSLIEYLKENIRAITGSAISRSQESKNIMDLGIDSLGLVTITEGVRRDLSIDLQPTAFFEYQSIAELASYLEQQFPESPSGPPTGESKGDISVGLVSAEEFNDVQYEHEAVGENVNSAPAMDTDFSLDDIFQQFQEQEIGSGNRISVLPEGCCSPKQIQTSGDIAVIGMAGRFARSENLDEFWRNLASQADLFSEIPADHFDYQPWRADSSEVGDHIYCNRGSFIDDVDKFDAAFFNISPKEAAILDPQLRILLQVIYQTVEDAGYGNRIRGSNTGMYVGACFHDYELELVRHMGEMSPYFGTGNALTMLANRPSFYLDLKGPSMPLDTACSASLVAIHTAIHALRDGDCEMAFVAGTNLLLSPLHYRYFCAIGALSKSGNSFPFDSRADGYIPGEAVGAVLLKPKEQAVKDGDHIHAVIKSTAVNHGGYSASFTAPSVNQEAEVIRKALRAGNIDPATISYIEAHGTGTALGDPIEVNGLKLAFQSAAEKKGFCALGTAKAHLGHAEGAAGIAGLLKVILSMKHKTIPSMPHLQELNPYIDIDNSPFYINRQNQFWQVPDNAPRRAGISSFGIGGAYAHVIVEEHVEDNPLVEQDRESVFVLSARNPERLAVYAGKMAEFIREHYLETTPCADSMEKELVRLVTAITNGRIEVLNKDDNFVDLGFSIPDFVLLSDAITETYNVSMTPRRVALCQNVSRLALDMRNDMRTMSETEMLPALPSLQEMAYTMQCGREPMDVRLAIVVKDKSALVKELQWFADKGEPNSSSYYGSSADNAILQDFLECPEGDAFVQNLAQSGRLVQLAKSWVAGVNIPWTILPANQNARMVSLPTYPFARQRFWFNDDMEKLAVPAPVVRKVAPKVEITSEDETREILRAIWLNHLSVDKLRNQDNFIELGGTSITTTQVVTDINRKFNIGLTNGEFAECASFADVCALVNGRRGDKEEESENFVIPASESDNVALSSDQLRLWILGQMYPDTTRHNISSAYYLNTEPDPIVLQEALDHVVEENTALRTCFTQSGGEPRQIIVTELKTELEVVDVPASENPIDYIHREAGAHFNVENGPLIKVTLLRHNGTAILSLVVHHIVADISSVDIIAKELIADYQSVRQGKSASDVSGHKRQFKDYLVWSAQQQKVRKQMDLEFWKQHLKGAPPVLNLPLDFPRQNQQTFNSRQVSFALDTNELEQLDSLARELRVTRFVLAFALFNLLLSRICDQKDILVGVPNANRNFPDTRNMVGFLANTLVLRTQVDPSTGFSQLVEQVKKTIYSAFDHQSVGYGDIVGSLDIPPAKNHNPLFQVLFNMIEREEALYADGELELKPLDLPLITLDFDILFTIDIRGSTIRGSMDYNPDLFADSTATGIIESYKTMLTDLLKARQQQREYHLEQSVLPMPEKISQHQNANEQQKARLLITSTFTAEPVEKSLKFWMDKLDLLYKVEFAPYNQVFQQLLDPNLELRSNENGVNVILLRYDDWTRFEVDRAEKSLEEKQRKVFVDFIDALHSCAMAMPSPIVLSVLPSADEQTNLHREFDRELKQVVAELNNVSLIDATTLAHQYPVEKLLDPIADEAGHVPFTPSYYVALGTAIARRIHARATNPYKVIVLDCDNTLWRGVVGEVGVEGIEFDEPRKQFHRFLIEQVNRGMLLCLVSKNVEGDVLNVFRQRDDIPLKLENILAWKVNWELKSENIRELAEELNLGLDSFIFIDDNPVECAEVEAALPQVLAVRFPQQPDEIARLSSHIWGLDVDNVTVEDKKRTEMYRQNLERSRVEAESTSFEEFLEKLDLNIEFEPLDDASIDRVEQLMHRTNQFNSTTRRHTAADIRAKISIENYECMTIKVSDRFGDYGLVGVLLYQIQEKCIKLDSFLLSCRVLGKGVEHRMIRKVAERAAEKRLNEIQLDFIESEKNIPVKSFYQSIKDATWVEESRCYRLQTSKAVTLEYSPSRGKNIKIKDSNIPASRVATPTRVLSRIALELNRVDRISAAIQEYIADSDVPQVGAPATRRPPENEIEQQLVAIYQSVLNKKVVDTATSFFDLGGNSLQLVELASRINEEMKNNIPVTILFQFPSISALAKHFAGGGRKNKSKMSKTRQRALKQREMIKKLQVA